MSGAERPIELLDLLRTVRDCAWTTQSVKAVEHLSAFFSTYRSELESMDDEHAIQCVVDVCRNLEIDFDVVRSDLDQRGRVLDFIRGVQSEPTVDLALEFARLHLRLDQLAANGQEEKGIVPTGIYSYDEAVRALGVSESTLRRDVRAGKLRRTMIRGCVRFSGTDLLAYQTARQPRIRVLGDA